MIGSFGKDIMRTNKSLFALIVVLLSVSLLTSAQPARVATPAKLNIVELEKQATTSSVEQALLRAAAAKLRQEKRDTGVVELSVVVSASQGTLGCYDICFGASPNQICIHRVCYRTE